MISRFPSALKFHEEIPNYSPHSSLSNVHLSNQSTARINTETTYLIYKNIDTPITLIYTFGETEKHNRTSSNLMMSTEDKEINCEYKKYLQIKSHTKFVAERILEGVGRRGRILRANGRYEVNYQLVVDIMILLQT